MTHTHQNTSNLAKWSVFHPVGVTLLALTVVVSGFFSLYRLNINLLPHLIYPEVRVRVLDPGTPATVMEEQVTRYLEEYLSATEDAISVQSQTSEGRSAVDLTFAYGKDIDIALRDASTRLDRAKRVLPDTIQPPVIYKRDPSQLPILEMAVSSSLRDAIELRTWVDHQLSKWFINLPGVASAEVGGGLVREIQVLPDQYKLAGYGLTLENLTQALQQDNAEVATGRLQTATQEISTKLNNRWPSVEHIANVPLFPHKQTVPLYLGNIAQILDTHQDERLKIRFNGIPSVKLSIQKQPQANTVEVVEQVLERLVWLETQQVLPTDVQLHKVTDQSVYIRHALKNTAWSAISGALLAMLVVFLFLGDIRRTLIIGTVIPLAVIGTFSLMALGGLTLNIMSLGGLALAVGMVVDNTIVMLENIVRHQHLVAIKSQFSPTSPPLERELGEIKKNSIDATLKAASEITSALVASTSTNLAAILPFLFILGLVGLLFRELIFTISAAMLTSLLVALTVVPAFAAKITTTQSKPLIGTVYISQFYAWLMKKVILKLPIVIILLFSTGLWLSLPAFLTNKQVFLPKVDDGMVRVTVTTEPGITLEEMAITTQKVEQFLAQQPAVASVYAQIGGFVFGRSQYEVTHRSSLIVQLLPFEQRQMSVENWIQQTRRKFKKLNLVGFRLGMRSAGIRGIRLGKSDENFSLRLQGESLDVLTRLATDIVAHIRDLPGLNDVAHSYEEVRQELVIQVDKTRAQKLGFTSVMIGNIVKTLINGKVVTDFIEGDQRFDVRLRLPKTQLNSVQNLDNLLLISSKGIVVRLGEVATIGWQPVPDKIWRDQQRRIVEITANLQSDIGIEAIYQQVQQRLANFELPKGYMLYEGDVVKNLQETRQLTQILLILAIFLVFVVMTVQYESLRNPIIILFSIPFVIIGVALGIHFSALPLSMPIWLGMIMLAGIVVNNAIVLVETIELERKSLVSVQEAIIQAGQHRLRPILMTTLTTVIGLLPLALGIGEGAELLQPLAMTIVWGLSFSLLVSLLLVPACYKLATNVM